MKIGHALAGAAMGLGMSLGPAALAQNIDDATPMVGAVEPLLRAARIDQLMQVVATEGARHGLGLEPALFPGKGGSSWELIVGAIQSPERLARRLAEVLNAELSAEDTALAASYLSDGPGARVVAREVKTRMEMLDGAIEAEAKRVSTDFRDVDPARAELIDELLASLDLLTTNVSGGLNANFAFYRGLGDGGALKKRLTESEMLAMVWAQEESVRVATRDWLQGYLTRAYAPLPEDDLRDYLAFTTTPTGKRYFAAMFAGFGTVFEETSYELGRAAARFMAQDDA